MEQGDLATWALVTLRRFDWLASAGDACRLARGALDGFDEIRRLALGPCELLLQMRAGSGELVAAYL
ncbi:MAG: hypothetical protein EXQ67_08945 [Thermoleophilia bacterium]|nr:hypothetical protein [Thermoleophilia bacterium]